MKLLIHSTLNFFGTLMAAGGGSGQDGAAAPWR